MRDGRGNKLSAEEVEKVRSLQVKPDPDSLKAVSIDPKRSDTGSAKDDQKAGRTRKQPGEGPVF